MKIPLRDISWVLLGGWLLFWRYEAARDGFEERRKALPSGTQGLFQALILEEPQVFLPRENGSHETGRSGGSYSPQVDQVRVICLLRSVDGVPLPPLKARCTFRLSPDKTSPVLSYGDEVVFRGKVQVPRRASNPGQFDYERYLRNKGVAFTAYLEPGLWEKGTRAPGGSFFLHACFSLKRSAEGALCRHLPYPQNALLDGILLGEKSGLPREMVEDFFLTGTVHILAVSGLMTAFVSGILFMGLRVLGFPRKWAAGTSLLGLAFFVCMTGADPPVCRSGLFSGLALGAVLLERRIHGGVLLLATALLLAFLEPFVMFDLSFQISFLATAGLMVGAPHFTPWFSFLGKPAAGLAAATVSAQLSVGWFLAYCFNQASPYALLANLVVVPLALLATGLGLGVLAGAALHPLLGDLLGKVCSLLLEALSFSAGTAAGFPGGEGLVPSPPGGLTLLFHLLLGGTFLIFWPEPVPGYPSLQWLKRRDRRLQGRRWVVFAWLGFTVLCLFEAGLARWGPPRLKVTYLAVGHGNAVVLETPGGEVWVVDAGRGVLGPDRFHPLVSFLRHRGLRRVDRVFATHPDSDHVGGIRNLIGACQVRTLSLPDPGEGAPFPSELIEACSRKGILIERLGAGQGRSGAGGLQEEVLHPDPSFRPHRDPDNNLSLVVQFTFGKSSFLFPGDLEKEGLLRLFSSSSALRKGGWLLAPHHGRRSGEPILSAQGFSPRYVVFSDGRDHLDSKEGYQEGSPGVQVLSTALEGAVEVEVKQDGSGRFRTFRGGKWGPLEDPTSWKGLSPP